MRRVGIGELRRNISKVLREVEQGETVEITNRGRIVARLMPVQAPQLAHKEMNDIIAYMDVVASQLGARWPQSVTMQDAIDDVRK